MMVNRFMPVALLFLLGIAVPSFGQPSQEERRTFEQTKARADRGEAEAQLSLGQLYATGTGVTKDASKAAKWHRKAAEQGLARAQYQLGLDYANGEGVKPDRIEAVRWIRRAAEQDFMEAQVDLGLIHLNGDGVRENGVEAVRWFRKVADQGYAYGEYLLGKCYFEGTGVTKDIAEGLRWTRLSAAQGCAPAQNSLGECFEKGNGVEKDLVEAYKWYNLALAQDSEHAADIRVSLAKLESALSKEEISRAQQMAREFKPGPRLKPDAALSTDPAAAASATNRGTGLASTPANPAGADASKIGFVTVKAEDESCEVYADGAFVGNPPAKLKLSDGTHVIEVKKPGFKDYRRQIKVTAGSDLNLRAMLEKQ